MPHGKKHDMIKSFAEGIFGKKLTTKSGGGGTPAGGGASQYLKDYERKLKNK